MAAAQAANVDRVQSQAYTRPAARRRSSAAAYGRASIRWPDRPSVGVEAEPGEVLEDRGVELRPAALPIVVLDPQQDLAPGDPARPQTQIALAT